MNFPFDIHAYLDILLRSSVVYLFMLFAFKVFGKRELSQLSISDLVLVLLISNAVQNAMVGSNSSLSGGLLAAAVLFSINYVVSYFKFKYKKVNNLLTSDPVLLVFDGKVKQKSLDDNLMTTEELMAAIREHGIDSLGQVQSAVLESDGNISVISKDDNHLKLIQYKRKRTHKSLQDI